jgi:ferredoxin-NADP reductase
MDHEPGHPFPRYRPGQYMALRREDCRLTERIPGDGVRFGPALDKEGQPRRGSVTHSYSLSSAPHETAETSQLEFYVVLEGGPQAPGRLTESLFRAREGESLLYVDHIVGSFTLEKRAAGFRHVVLVASGTGLAPFASMVKHLAQGADASLTDGKRYTLIHANRTRAELGYNEVLSEIDRKGAFDFVYLPAVSRPGAEDLDDPGLGTGRANSLLRAILGVPETLGQATLPRSRRREELLARMPPGDTVVMTCGNPALMQDVERVATQSGLHFEKEEW